MLFLGDHLILVKPNHMVDRTFRTEGIRIGIFIVGTMALLVCRIEVELRKRNIVVSENGKAIADQLQAEAVWIIYRIAVVVKEQVALLQIPFIENEENGKVVYNLLLQKEDVFQVKEGNLNGMVDPIEGQIEGVVKNIMETAVLGNCTEGVVIPTENIGEVQVQNIENED